MYTAGDIAEKLKVTKRTVYRWIDDGKLPALKIEGIIRIKESDYLTFIKSKPEEN